MIPIRRLLTVVATSLFVNNLSFDAFPEVREKADRHNMVLLYLRKEMMAAIGDAVLQDASVQPYAMRSKLVDAYCEKCAEEEALLQRRKGRIRAESKGMPITIAKRPVEDTSDAGVEGASQGAVVAFLKPAPVTPVGRETKRRLRTLSAMSIAGFGEVGAFMTRHPPKKKTGKRGPYRHQSQYFQAS